MQAKIPNSKIRDTRKTDELPVIPEKRYFTIGEASDLCGVKPYVLRYWETEFAKLKPSTRRGNRRYYEHKDILIAREIRELLYLQGFTIDGARSRLSGRNTASQAQVQAPPQRPHQLMTELEELLDILS